MNFNNQLSLIKTLIPEGEVDTRIDCPFCNHTNTLIIRRINSDLFWNCFHASCSAKGKHQDEVTMQQVYETVVAKRKEKEICGNQGALACDDISGSTQFRLSDGTVVTNTAEISRGFFLGKNPGPNCL